MQQAIGGDTVKSVNININGLPFQADKNDTILEAAKKNGIIIPSLCHLEGVHDGGYCRICVVEVEGERNLRTSCNTKVKEGMILRTNTPKVKQVRKIVYELMLSNHPKDCLSCTRNQHCEFQSLGELIQTEEDRFTGTLSNVYVDTCNPSIERDISKCILCRRCITICNEIQGVGAINMQNRGFDSFVGPPETLNLNDVNCVLCGQCTTVCPVNALKEKDSIEDVKKALNDPTKRVLVQTAPAIRAALGEEFGYEPGTLVTGKMVTALRLMGFDDVFDTNFAADLTILEEGTEFLGRVKKTLSKDPVTLPMITSCSPGWIKYIEHTYPDLLPHLSTCKSPHMMLGALAKSYYADIINEKPENIYVVSIMPCTAKKYECTREEMIQDVDAVLTTRELARMIKDYGIDFVNLKEEKFDDLLGFSSGAADIFANTGGVMEAAVRTVYEIITGREIPFEDLHIQPIMGLESIKEGSLTIEDPGEDWKALEGFEVKIAVASGLKSAKKLLQQIEDGTSPYHFIEIMACPGGCISGGGQPRLTTDEIRQKRLEAIYREDEGKSIRKSHLNPEVNKLYEAYLGKPNGELSHKLLHTHYVARGTYNEQVK